MNTRRSAVARLLAAVLGAATAMTAYGQEGDLQHVRLLSSAYPAALQTGAAEAADAIEAIVQRAAQVRGELGQPLLPAGTTLDAAGWEGSVLTIHLTLPEGPPGQSPAATPDDTPDTPVAHPWRLSPLDLETLSRAFAMPFLNDSGFGGVRTRIRIAADQPYGSLERFVPRPPVPSRHEEALADPDALVTADAGAGVRLGGPTINAARQPTGALSGVVVFASAGHGWTAGDSTWFLQRPLLWDMNEDYGNLDMLNYFVHFAFNAGATVVPMRPVGWQPIEIVLDQDDPGVTFTGTWTDSTNAKHYENGVTNSGVAYKFATADVTETATARYTPTISVTDFYPVFGFAVASGNRTLQTYRISHSGGVSEVTVDHREVGNGWIWLGMYYLEAGGDNWVEITNESPEAGVVVADAIRWGDGMGDIVRPGPGTISGFPRDEEAQRYWGQSEWGNNAAGFDSSIWDPGFSDQSDNVGTGARIAREMNQVPAGGVQVGRWKRVHIEFHTNASGGAARGQICLITDTGSTTNQATYATTLSNEVDADLSLVDSEFEHGWVDRSSPTFTSSYGAISTSNNSDEFDATIVELAFHDNQLDAELLRDPRVRQAMARACLHGIIRFLNALPGSQVPLAFAPDTPRDVVVEDLGNGDVRVSWQPPLSDGARGDPATGYVVYQSTNGYGFGDPIVLGDVLNTTISSVPVSETRYFRVAATNAGGESMPSEVLAVRRPSTGTARVLIVNGFDRLRRQINPIQDIGAGLIERQKWMESNRFDYVVQHAEALGANDVGFASTSNEALVDLTVQLEDYDIAVWILGTESVEDVTFTNGEQNKITNFLGEGGTLFVSGAEVGFDLINQGGGVSFAQDTLRIGFSADDANTFQVQPAAGGILDGLGSFDFDVSNGAPYEVRTPDVLSAGTDAQACLNYVGGLGGPAGVQFAGPVYHSVVFGFPFETITSPSMRASVMQRVIQFLEAAPEPLVFDTDGDGDVDFDDFQLFAFCMHGPEQTYSAGHFCLDTDGDGDRDVDMGDFSGFQLEFTGPIGP